MAKKALRQGMQVSIKELKELADELLEEALEAYAEIGIAHPKILEKKWIISIINKQPKCSDTWEIEKDGIRFKKIRYALKRLRKAKKNIKQSQIEDLVQEVRYGKKKGKRNE